MHIAIYCIDNPATPNLRETFYDEHRAYLREQETVKILIAGPLLAENSENKIGSLLVVEADEVDVAKKFSANDPFSVNQVWREVSLHPYVKAIDNR
ncbi:YciI family protein [Agrobacterium tumefaciens]|uniref:YciI family protein n=1 Tax=Agrobacterium tumefaciens TaxID=358 RepID=UPI001572C98B|nr:YciI family protein [Agrobacterium tumefaciens]NTB94889.1 YciI family protein [Agrobacterium tumefaciens]NTC44010.1 YciI family protein [Agrobacterium tumefaciens]